MPTPAKAYVDPTGFIRASLTPALPLPYAFNPVIPPLPPGVNPMVVLVRPSNFKVIVNQPSTIIGSRITIPPPFTIKIPTPPMGRQQIITFPSIYKERNANSTRPLVGQQWPRLEKPQR